MRKRRPSAQGFQFTLGGILFILVSILIGLAAMNSEASLLFLVFGLCMGAVLASGLISSLSLRRLSVTRRAPDAAATGEPFVVRYRIRSHRRLGRSYSLHLRDLLDPDRTLSSPEAYVPVLGPGRSVVVDVPVVVTRRGALKFDQIRVATRFPFGLFAKFTTTRIPHEMTIYPALGRLRRDVVSRSRRGRPGGEQLGDRKGGSEEFYGVREYRSGDSPKWIHWRRSARTGQLVVREMLCPPPHHLLLVVDTRRAPGDSAAAELRELAISCAATIGCAALERGFPVGLIGTGDPVVVLPPACGRVYRQKMLRELATLRASDAVSPAHVISRLRWSPGWQGRGLLIAAHEDDQVRRAAGMLISRGADTTVLSADGPSFQAVFDPRVSSVEATATV